MYQAIRPVMLKEGPDCEQSGETKEDLRRASEKAEKEEGRRAADGPVWPLELG